MILVACEESQRVCMAFRDEGFEAYSCDLIECSGGHPEWHIQGDVLPLLNGNCRFTTMDGVEHVLDGRWEMIVAHPPCTFLTGAGACNIPKHPERIELGHQAARFFMTILSADCERIVVENPPPMKRFGLPEYSQISRPWMFGDSNNKAICLWLKGVRPLRSTRIVEKDKDIVRWVHKATGKNKSCSKWYNTNTNKHSRHRSVTFPGIARAMAKQWGGEIRETR